MSPRISSQWLWYSCSQGMICSGATRNRGLKAWPRAACKCKGRGKNQNQVYTKSERRNARERLVLLHYSEVPLPSPQAKIGSRETPVLLTKALLRSIRIFTSPCKGNKGHSKGSQKCLGSQWQQSYHSSANPESEQTRRERGLEPQTDSAVPGERTQREMQSRAAHIHQLEPQLCPKAQSTAAQSPCPFPHTERTE